MRRLETLFQAVELVRMESGPAQAVLPLVGLAADNITRDPYSSAASEHLSLGTRDASGKQDLQRQLELWLANTFFVRTRNAATPTMTWLYVIDPFERLHPETDTTYAIMRESARRDIPSYVCTIQDLIFTDGVAANVREIRFGGGDARLGRIENRLLNDFSLIFMRKEPPYDLAFHYATALLSLTETPVLNAPEALRSFNEKLIILNFPNLIPTTIVSADIAELERFADEHHEGVVVKALDSYQGKMVHKLKKDDANFHDLLESATQDGILPIMLQQYLPGISEGDKRIILLSGKVLGAVKRMPAAGGYISNLGAGGTEHKTVITAKEQELISTIEPFLMKHDIHFAGLDVISEQLTEINITCPTGLQHINRLEGKRLENEVVDRFEQLARH